MPADAMNAGPCAWRYFDYPRPGSIFRLPDIPSLVRGYTIVQMKSGHEVRVPAQLKSMVASPAETHDMQAAQGPMQQLLKVLQGRQGPTAPAGFKTGPAASFQDALGHPRERPREAMHNGQALHF